MACQSQLAVDQVLKTTLYKAALYPDFSTLRVWLGHHGVYRRLSSRVSTPVVLGSQWVHALTTSRASAGVARYLLGLTVMVALVVSSDTLTDRTVHVHIL